jgi:hypothetical protein
VVDLDVDPARGSVDGGKEVLSAVLIRHSGQIFDVNMHEARFVVLEGLDWTHFLIKGLGLERLEVGDTMTAQTAIQD